MDDLPVQPGTYALILELPDTQTVDVGRLGSFAFPAGFYVYLGSARGSGGIRARLGRHLRGDGASHWHIDYLRKVSVVRGYGFTSAVDSQYLLPHPQECEWAQKLAAHFSASIPVSKFGASDCQMNCPAHLVYFPNSDIHKIISLLMDLEPNLIRQK